MMAQCLPKSWLAALPFPIASMSSTTGPPMIRTNALPACPVNYIVHESNQGKAASLVAGFAAAMKDGASCMVTIDADQQHNPLDIEHLIAAHEANPQALIIGSRFERAGRILRHRLAANRIARYWISKACGQLIRDSQSGLRLYPFSLVQAVQPPHSRSRSFVFESEILIDAARSGFPIEFISIDPVYPSQPARQSHYKAVLNTARIFKMAALKIIAGRRATGDPAPVERSAQSGSSS